MGPSISTTNIIFLFLFLRPVDVTADDTAQRDGLVGGCESNAAANDAVFTGEVLLDIRLENEGVFAVRAGEVIDETVDFHALHGHGQLLLPVVGPDVLLGLVELLEGGVESAAQHLTTVISAHVAKLGDLDRVDIVGHAVAILDLHSHLRLLAGQLQELHGGEPISTDASFIDAARSKRWAVHLLAGFPLGLGLVVAVMVVVTMVVVTMVVVLRIVVLLGIVALLGVVVSLN